MKRSREPDSPQHQASSPASIHISDDGGGPDPATPHNDDTETGTRSKCLSLDPSQSDAGDTAQAAMICQLHRDKLSFPSYDAYETHYNKEHLNRCLECRKNFPSPFYLSLHTDEWHNPFVAVKRDRGEHTYACFVEGCERLCGSSDKRRRHLIDKHAFPKNFFFNITQYGIDGRQSLLLDGGRRQHQRRQSLVTSAKKDVRRRAASITTSPPQTPRKEGSKATAKPPPSKKDKDAMEEDDDDDDDSDSDSDEEEDDDDDDDDDSKDVAKHKGTASPPKETPDVQMDDLAGAMSAMTFIPRSVRFGRGGKSGFARR